MKKLDIDCKYSKRNPYKHIQKEADENKRVSNILKRNFKQYKYYKALLTDITYLFYGNGKKAYLLTILDSSTNEILSYKLSQNLKIDFVIYTVKNINFKNIKLDDKVLIYSAQGEVFVLIIHLKNRFLVILKIKLI